MPRCETGGAARFPKPYSNYPLVIWPNKGTLPWHPRWFFSSVFPWHHDIDIERPGQPCTQSQGSHGKGQVGTDVGGRHDEGWGWILSPMVAVDEVNNHNRICQNLLGYVDVKTRVPEIWLIPVCSPIYISFLENCHLNLLMVAFSERSHSNAWFCSAPCVRTSQPSTSSSHIVTESERFDFAMDEALYQNWLVEWWPTRSGQGMSQEEEAHCDMLAFFLRKMYGWKNCNVWD